MNKDYGEIENQLLLYKPKEEVVKMYIELLTKVDKAIEYINENEDVDLYDDVGSAFCRKLLEILRGVDENN